jgi:hypothetical protein
MVVTKTTISAISAIVAVTRSRIRPTLATDVQGIPRLITEAVSVTNSKVASLGWVKLGLHQERWHAVVDLGGSVMITVRIFSRSPVLQFFHSSQSPPLSAQHEMKQN